MNKNNETLIDFHNHTFHSDGILSPMELVRRAQINGYSVVGITDHVDFSNLESVGKAMLEFARRTQDYFTDITIIPGIELTHNPPELTKNLIEKARNLNIPLVIVHGETPVEPVPEGTNRAAIEAGADILAHPGFISKEEIVLAIENNVALEVTARCGHNITNGRLVAMTRKIIEEKELSDMVLVIDSDSHSIRDLLTVEHRRKVGLGAGLSQLEYNKVGKNMSQLAEKFIERIPWL